MSPELAGIKPAQMDRSFPELHAGPGHFTEAGLCQLQNFLGICAFIYIFRMDVGLLAVMAGLSSELL